MAALDALLDFFLFLFFAGGSSTIGYLFLRVGWPKIRSLKKSYKKGWGVIFGLGFAVAVAALALIFSFLPFFGLGYREFFFLFLSTGFLLSMGTLTVARKSLGKGRVTVSVTGPVVAKKGINQIAPKTAIAIRQRQTEPPKTTEKRKSKPLTNLVPTKTAKKEEQPAVKPQEPIPTPAARKPPEKKQKYSGDTGFAGLKTSELFEEDDTPEPPTGSEMKDIKEIEEIGKEIEKTRPPEEEPGGESPLQKLLKEKKKKIKFLKEED